jgi:hypothetical protein
MFKSFLFQRLLNYCVVYNTNYVCIIQIIGNERENENYGSYVLFPHLAGETSEGQGVWD